MKLFDTMPPFERFRKQLESHPRWLSVGSAMRMAALDATKACCERGRPPDKLTICFQPVSSSPHIVVDCIAWCWRLRPGCATAVGLLTVSPAHGWDFTTYRRPTHGGPGRIGETFSESSFSTGALDRFFGKMDRIRKEEVI